MSLRHTHASRGLMLAEKSCPAARSVPCAMFWPCCKAQPDAHLSHARVMPCAAPFSGSLAMRMHRHSTVGRREREGQREGESCRGRQREGEREIWTARKKLPICAQRAMHRGREGTPREREGRRGRQREGEGGAARERLVDDRVASPIGKPPTELHAQGLVRALSIVTRIFTHTDTQSSQDLRYV